MAQILLKSKNYILNEICVCYLQEWMKCFSIFFPLNAKNHLRGGFVMKRILTVLCLMFMLPVPLFAQDFTFKTMRFFEGGYNVPDEAQRRFTGQFPKSATRYVWCQIDVENRLHNVREQTHKVVWRYYNPDGTLRGEPGLDFRIKPEWYTAWIPYGWGWDEPGNWPVGTYRVEIWIDGQKMAQDLFTIYDDRASTSPPIAPEEKTFLQYESVKFFESGYTAPPKEQRRYTAQFPKSSTRYVFFEVGSKNLLYRNRTQRPLVSGRYYNADGSLRGEAKVNVEIPSDWENADLWSGWGKDEPGSWPVGTYRVEIWFASAKVGEGTFTIYDDRSSTSPPVTSVPDEKVYLEFQSVKFFESGATDPPASQRQFSTDFSRSGTRYINFFVLARNLFYRSRSQKPLVRGRYFYPDGSFMGEATVNVEIPPDWQDANLWAGWGWDKPGNWSLGTYRVEILFGNAKVGEGRFSISDDRK